ncbi:MAG: ribonuclease HII [Alphaproteobacteria bacterium]|nr:MAG: ribonuclease HII [Alphaproteobacteria bacterium]
MELELGGEQLLAHNAHHGTLDYSCEAALPGPVAGVDEAGRGPLAGPVVAAAVILDPDNLPDGIRDSKALTTAQRDRLFAAIQKQARGWAIAAASVAEIDRLNVLRATMTAMVRAITRLRPRPRTCLIDGNAVPRLERGPRCLAVIGGDAQVLSIAAAGILAKVMRDRIMARLARRYPDYGWEKNAGYGVRAHLETLRLVGVTPHHRKSFAPVSQVLLQGNLPIT